MQVQDISVRKFRRKVRQNGVKQATLDAAELLSRKYLAPPIYDVLLDRGMIELVDEKELLERATRIVRCSEGDTSSRSHRPFVAELDAGYILPITGLSLTDDYGLIGESVGHPEIYEWFTMEALIRHDFVADFKIIPKLLFDHDSLKSSSEHIDTAAPLCPRYRNYFHWMIQAIPRLRYLRRYERETGREVTLVVPPEYPPWLRESLSILGWPNERIVQQDVALFHVNTLVIPPFLGLDTDFPGLERDDIEWIRRQFLPSIQAPKSDSVPPRVFISREGAIERRIINQKEFSKVLSRYGFTTYRLEDRTLRDNIRLFNEAEVVIGTHGAGLADIVFCEDCTVVELFGSKVKGHYEWLAEKLDLAYYPIHCTPKSTDLIVDTEQLEELFCEELGFSPEHPSR